VKHFIKILFFLEKPRIFCCINCVFFNVSCLKAIEKNHVVVKDVILFTAKLTPGIVVKYWPIKVEMFKFDCFSQIVSKINEILCKYAP
jgi:hypothetical protein